VGFTWNYSNFLCYLESENSRASGRQLQWTKSSLGQESNSRLTALYHCMAHMPPVFVSKKTNKQTNKKKREAPCFTMVHTDHSESMTEWSQESSSCQTHTWLDIFLIWTYFPVGSTSLIWMNPAALESTLACWVAEVSIRSLLVFGSLVWVRERWRFSRGVGVKFSLRRDQMSF